MLCNQSVHHGNLVAIPTLLLVIAVVSIDHIRVVVPQGHTATPRSPNDWVLAVQGAARRSNAYQSFR